MFAFIFTFALVLPYLQGKLVRICDNTNVTVTGDEFFKVFNYAIKDSKNSTYDKWGTEIPRAIFKYVSVANESCYHDTISREIDGLEFYKLMRFSMTQGFKGFIENRGVPCILAIKDKLTNCVQDNVGVIEGVADKYHTLWKKIQLDIGLEKKPCEEVKAVKECTLNAIRNEGYYKCDYSPNVAVYVGSLFEYVLERCIRLKKLNAGYSSPSENEVPELDHTSCSTKTITNILLGTLLTLQIILLAYVGLRYCRASGGRWSINEIFTMRNRSHDHNALGQEN